jgi:hypothetical protein
VWVPAHAPSAAPATAGVGVAVRTSAAGPFGPPEQTPILGGAGAVAAAAIAGDGRVLVAAAPAPAIGPPQQAAPVRVTVRSAR